MTQKFKLKKQARQFFDEKYHKAIKELKYWQEEKIRSELLDEVDAVYVDYGHEHTLSSGTRCSDLSGWDSEKAQFKFTVNILDIKNTDYEKIKVAEMMDEIQKTLNKYVKQWWLQNSSNK